MIGRTKNFGRDASSGLMRTVDRKTWKRPSRMVTTCTQVVTVSLEPSDTCRHPKQHEGACSHCSGFHVEPGGNAEQPGASYWRHLWRGHVTARHHITKASQD